MLSLLCISFGEYTTLSSPTVEEWGEEPKKKGNILLWGKNLNEMDIT
jgi:hypothetical protein